MASLKNSVRVEVRSDASEEVKKGFGLEWMCEKLIREISGLSMSQVYCLQDFSKAGMADITFVSPRTCQDFYAACVEKASHESLKGLKVKPLFGGVKVPLVVHMYNPYVEEQEIRTFLKRYCEEVSVGEKLANKYDIWSGRRKYIVSFKTTVQVAGGVMYPPASFAIGPNRGFLWFPGQPLQCWKCGATGHSKEHCTGQRCRNCGKEGHVAVQCGEAKVCSLCGSPDHLYRLCPKRGDSYASRAGGTTSEEGEASRQTEEQEVESEMEVDREAVRKRSGSWAEDVESEERRQNKVKHMGEKEADILEPQKRKKKTAAGRGGEKARAPGGKEESSNDEPDAKTKVARDPEKTGGTEDSRSEKDRREERRGGNKFEGLFSKEGWREVEGDLLDKHIVTKKKALEWIKEIKKAKDTGEGVVIECEGGQKYRVRDVKELQKVCRVLEWEDE